MAAMLANSATELYHSLLLLQESKTILFTSDTMLALSPSPQTRDPPINAFCWEHIFYKSLKGV